MLSDKTNLNDFAAVGIVSKPKKDYTCPKCGWRTISEDEFVKHTICEVSIEDEEEDAEG